MEMRDELEALLFGSDVIEKSAVAKFEPNPSDLAPWRKNKYQLTPAQQAQHKDRQKRLATAGLSTVGAGAGALGLAVGAKEVGQQAKKLGSLKAGFKATPKLTRALIPAEVAGLGGELMATKILHGDAKRKKKIDVTKRHVRWGDVGNITVGAIGAGAGVASLGQNKKQQREIKTVQRNAQKAKLVAVEAGRAVQVAPRTPGQAKAQAAGYAYTKTKQQLSKGFIKNIKVTAANAAKASESSIHAARYGADTAQNMSVITRRVRRATGPVGAAVGAGLAGGGYAAGTKHNQTKAKLKGKLRRIKAEVNKVEFAGELSKMDSDKMQAFGWASVTKVDGKDVYDRQGDYIALDEIEKSAYHYVTNSRRGGVMHERAGETPLQVSDMVESFVVTPEKLEKMGLDSDALPHGWWVGFKINDDAVWADVKNGKKLGFSIHGKGIRTPMAVEEGDVSSSR